MNSASLWSLAGRYDNPIPPRYLAPIDFLKIPALARQGSYAGGIDSLESILGLLKSLKIWAQATKAGGIDSLESIPGLLKRLQFRAQVYATVYSLFLDTTWMGRSNTTCLFGTWLGW
jgi:hypothetical protein